eukprot:s2059_g4.t1
MNENDAISRATTPALGARAGIVCTPVDEVMMMVLGRAARDIDFACHEVLLLDLAIWWECRRPVGGGCAGRAQKCAPRVLQLLTKSIRGREVSEVLLHVLRELVVSVPCPPVAPDQAAQLLCASITTATEAVLQNTQSILEQPDDLAALFLLLADAVRPSLPGTAGNGPCEDKLRPLIIAHRVLVGRCLSLVSVALPECRSQVASTQMIRFVTRLMSAEEAEPEAHSQMLKAALSPICAALCRAMAEQDFFEEPEALTEAGELLLAAAAVLPADLPSALTAGLGHALLEQHVQARAEWSQKGHWLEQLQQIVAESVDKTVQEEVRRSQLQALEEQRERDEQIRVLLAAEVAKAREADREVPERS